MAPEIKIPGTYSSINDDRALEKSKELIRRFIMSLQKIIMGPDGNVLKINPDGTISTNDKSSEIIKPVDIQSRYAQTIQTHTSAIIAPSATTASAGWIDCDGFDKIAITILNDSAKPGKAHVRWSNDGVNVHGQDLNVATMTTSSANSSGSTETKARYAQINIANDDTVVHTISAWAYLKA